MPVKAHVLHELSLPHLSYAGGMVTAGGLQHLIQKVMNAATGAEGAAMQHSSAESKGGDCIPVDACTHSTITLQA